jgi:hypothetical protein
VLDVPSGVRPGDMIEATVVATEGVDLVARADCEVTG